MANIDHNTYWVLFCFKGDDGIKSIRIVNKLIHNKPNGFYCQDFYGSGKFNVIEIVPVAKASD